jgi:hypothetical protein
VGLGHRARMGDVVSSSFGDRMDELIESVGDGTLTGSVVVDQVYAKYQHERMDLKHPQGGQARYLGQPLLDKNREYVRQLADAVLHGSLQQAMEVVVEDLATKQIFDKAPREFQDLRQSGHPRVMNGELITYDRAPLVHRLTADELKAKDKARAQGKRTWV